MSAFHSFNPVSVAGGTVATDAGIPRAGWLDIVKVAISANGVASVCNAIVNALSVVHDKLPQADTAVWTDFTSALNLIVNADVLLH